MSDWREPFLDAMRTGIPAPGPVSVHVDLTNTCNAACVTCWDHSPHLRTPRAAEWKRRRMPRERFLALRDELLALGTVRHVILSGMGDPLTHPDAAELIAACSGVGWDVTVISNLIAMDADALIAARPEQLLVGVHGVTPDTYAAFHPGWSEVQFFRLCAHLRALAHAPIRVRHVHVIERHNAHELAAMVRFGRTFGAERVTFKLASLAAGTEVVGIDDEQREALATRWIPEARALAERLRVATNLALFERQLGAGGRATVPLDEVACHMGHVFTRITVDEEVLYCCNTAIPVGSLRDAPFAELWRGERWQALRARIAARGWFDGCERCGKLEQNVKWGRLLREDVNTLSRQGT
ncbi:MAG: radical SAM protein [Myxococcales bacterium]|nr:radical SAM protein [Myxococcales bacterium]